MHNFCSIGTEAEHYLNARDAAIYAVVLKSSPLCPRGLKKLGSGTGALRIKKGARRLHKKVQLFLEGSVLEVLALGLEFAPQRGEPRIEFYP